MNDRYKSLECQLSSTVSSPKSWTILLIVALGVIVVVVIGIIAYLYVVNQKKAFAEPDKQEGISMVTLIGTTSSDSSKGRSESNICSI